MLQLKDQHKVIVEQNIRPEFSVVKESWMNPKLSEPRSASQIMEKIKQAKSIKMMHAKNSGNIFNFHQYRTAGNSIPFGSPNISNINLQDFTVGKDTRHTQVTFNGPSHQEAEFTIPDQTEPFRLGPMGIHTNQDLGFEEDLRIEDHGPQFFERRNDSNNVKSPSVKASFMKPHCDQQTYSLMRSKVSQQDFDQRMKVKKTSRFLQPQESIPFKNMMRKIKNHHHAFRGNPEKLKTTLNEILTGRERMADTLVPHVDHILIGESTPSGMNVQLSRSQQEGEIGGEQQSLQSQEQRRDDFLNLK